LTLPTVPARTPSKHFNNAPVDYATDVTGLQIKSAQRNFTLEKGTTEIFSIKNYDILSQMQNKYAGFILKWNYSEFSK